MKLSNNIKLSIKALLTNKLRTILSIAAMAVGTAAVIISTALCEGAREQALEPIIAMGTNIIVVNAAKITNYNGRDKQILYRTTLKMNEIENFPENPLIEMSSGFQQLSLSVKYQNVTTNTLVQGVEPCYPKIRNYTIEKGTFFNNSQNAIYQKVAILGSITVRNLFKNQNPLGKTIYINNIPFTVIGILGAKGTTGEQGNIDNVVMIPIRTALRRVFNIDYLSQMYFKIYDFNYMTDTEQFITNFIRESHKLNIYKKEDDFTIINQVNTIRASEETTSSFRYLTNGIALISLIIGGAAIFAIMSISVRERKPEIGLRMAVGAKKYNIILQFVSESLLLGCSGGISGIIVGLLTSWLLGIYTEWYTVIPLSSVTTPLKFSLLTGLIFGVVPAYRASQLDPVISLKS